MTALKITTWNIKHLGRILPPAASGTKRNRLDAIARQIRTIDPDVLCLQEADNEVEGMRALAEVGLNGDYALVEQPGTEAALALSKTRRRQELFKLYRQKGAQWIWFLVKRARADDAGLLDLRVWKELAGPYSWPVHFWGKRETESHEHYRHPQALRLEVAGVTLEVIGAHLRSKHVTTREIFEADGTTLTQAFLDEALADRIKLTTEAINIRRYVDARFELDPAPRILVLGDMNDGPGKERLEREYIFFDLLSNLQGEVFLARRFLNHALFDFPDGLRWSYRLSRRDPIDRERDRKILLDHILLTQPLVGAAAHPRVMSGAGRVEHVIHAELNATLAAKEKTSDHVPVSVTLSLPDPD